MEPAGLADAAALGDVLRNRSDLLGREPGIGLGGALATARRLDPWGDARLRHSREIHDRIKIM